MNAVTPVSADTAMTTQREARQGTDLLYVPNEPIFASAGPMIHARGWSVIP